MPSPSFSAGIAPDTRLPNETLFQWIGRAQVAYSEVKELPTPTREPLHRIIDHTLLKPESTPADLQRHCEEARKWSFYSVCVNPVYVPLASHLLKGTETRVITVVGFPLGASAPASKAFEARQAIQDGAQEIDMVLCVGKLRGGDWQAVYEDILTVREACGPIPLKVILETALLDDTQKLAACALTRLAGAAFVKTSTGFSSGGATVSDIKLMRWAVGPHMGVKASGGVRTRADADALVAAGANRLGASASVAICQGLATTPGKGSY